MMRRRSMGASAGGHLANSLGDRYISGGAPAFSGLGDALIAAGATVVGGYSLSHRRTVAQTLLCRIRRASDNATLDVGFGADNRLDTAAIIAHCLGTDGFLVTLYDWSGAGRDVTNATAAQQPKIYDSVAGLNLQGTLPFAIFAAASAQRLSRGDAFGLTGSPNLTIAYFFKVPAFAARRMFAVLSAGANSFYAGIESASGDPMNGITGVARRNFAEATALTTASFMVHRIAAAANISASTARQDGVDLAQVTVIAGAVNLANNAFTIGAEFSGGAPLDGSGCEMIVLNNDASGAVLTALEAIGAELRSLD